MQNKLTQNPVWQKWFFYFTLIAAGILFYTLINNFGPIQNFFSTLFGYFMPFILGALLAYIFSIPCRKLELFLRSRRQKFLSQRAEIISVVTVFTVLILLIVLSMSFIIPATFSSLAEFVSNLTNYLDNARHYLLEFQATQAWAADLDVNAFFDSLSLKEIAKNISFESIWQSFQSIIGLSSSIANAFLTLIVTFYFLLDAKKLRRFLVKAFHAYMPKKHAEVTLKYIKRSNEYFKKYIYYNTIDSLIVGIATTIGMLFMAPQYALPLGIIEGVLNMIPYFGAIIGSIIVIVIVMLTSGFGYGIAAAIFLLILQQIDGNILKPKLFGDSLDMNPLLVVLSITIGGAIYGVLGMFLAVPICAIIKNICTDLLNKRAHNNNNNN